MPEADGALTSIYAATAPELEGVTGRYFDKAKEAKPNKATGNAEAARHLWQNSRLGLPSGPMSTHPIAFIALCVLVLGVVLAVLYGFGDGGSAFALSTDRVSAFEGLRETGWRNAQLLFATPGGHLLRGPTSAESRRSRRRDCALPPEG